MLMEVHNSSDTIQRIGLKRKKEKKKREGGGKEAGNSPSPQQYLALIKYTGDTKPK